MKLSTLIFIMAVFSLVWGAGFLLLPVQVWSLYGVELDLGGIYMARELGTVFFMLGSSCGLPAMTRDRGLCGQSPPVCSSAT